MCQLSPAQEEDTAIVSDTTDDLWFLTEGESEQVSVEMKEDALEEGSRGEGEAPPEDEDGGRKEEKADREVRVSTKLDLLRCLSNRVLSVQFCLSRGAMWFSISLFSSGNSFIVCFFHLSRCRRSTTKSRNV